MSASKGKRTGKQSKASRKQNKQPATRRAGRRKPKGFQQSLVTAPASFGSIDTGSAMQFRESSIKRHPILGIPGVRLVGRQPLCDVNKINASWHAFSNAAGSSAGAMPDDGSHLGTLYTGNYIEMSPLDLGGMLQRYGNLYQKFVFRRIRIIYTTRIGTNTTTAGNLMGELALGFSMDPGLGTAADPPTSFNEIRYLPDSATTVLWAPKVAVNYSYQGMETYFCQYTTAQYSSYSTEADKSAIDSMYRLASQCLFSGFFDELPSASYSIGRLDIEYEIEFYSPNYGSIGTYTAGSLDKKMIRRPGALQLNQPRAKKERADEKERKVRSSEDPVTGSPAETVEAPPLGGDFVSVETELASLLKRIETLKACAGK